LDIVERPSSSAAGSVLKLTKEGDTILLGFYGNGAEVFLFRVTGEFGNLKTRRWIKGWLQSKSIPTACKKYLSYRSTLRSKPKEFFCLLPSATAPRKDHRSILRLHGSKSRNSGILASPIQWIYYKGSFEGVRLSGKRRKIYTPDNSTGNK
jgi:hypothetical protein